MFESIEFVRNITPETIHVILEPWGSSLELSPACFKVIAQSPQEEKLERKLEVAPSQLSLRCRNN
jgi:hypothetical protein